MALVNKVSYLCQVQYLYRNIKRYSVYIKNRSINFDSWKEKFSNVLIEPNNVSKETWESMRNFAVELTKKNGEVVDSLLLEVFTMENCVDAGVNYYKFLETNNYHLSATIVANYLKLYQQKEELTDADKAHILHVCENIVKNYKLLSAFQVNAIVSSLCKLDKWKEAIEIIKQFEAHDSGQLNFAYPALINCLLQNDELELADKYLITGMQKNISSMKYIYNTYMTWCLKKRDTFNERIEKLFSLWRKYGIKPTKDVIDKCITVCNEAGWSAQLTAIPNSQCNMCHQTVKETQLSEKEFNCLYEAIVKNVITDNTYKVSDPHEWEAFTKFMNKHKPYDFVVDGLNLVKSFPEAIQLLEHILGPLTNDGKKVLIIGRIHMKKLLQKLQFPQTVNFFLVNNLSKDDAFILYATFLSGKNTNMLSKDLMRQHKFTFHNVELDGLFKRWQKMHQYMFTNSGKLTKLDSVASIDSFPQKKGNYWHIPYHADSTLHLTKRHTCEISWVCFNMRP